MLLDTDCCMDHAVKTTLDLDDSLLAQAKAQAVRERTTLTRLVEEGLSLRMRKPSHTTRTKRPTLPVLRGTGGLRPGIDPTSNRSLFEAAGDDDA
jgi:hypothetical protein